PRLIKAVQPLELDFGGNDPANVLQSITQTCVSNDGRTRFRSSRLHCLSPGCHMAEKHRRSRRQAEAVICRPRYSNSETLTGGAGDLRPLESDLTSLRLFIAVCEHGNLARAAEQEHLVSSALSKRMAQLEARMGSPLLERLRYGVRPTPAGETVLAYAKDMLATAGRLENAMAAYTDGVRGQVRVLANTSVMAEALADDVVAFMQDPNHANIRIDIEERLSPAVISGVREGTAQVGIVWDRVNLHGLQHRAYRQDHMGA